MPRNTSFPAATLRQTLALAAATWAALGGAASVARAELTWTTREFTGSLAPGVESLTTRFEFKNTGTATVRVTDVRTSCGCTSAKVDRSDYPPGQAGVLDVEFAAKGSVGLKEQILHVITDEPGREPYQVAIKVNIAEWFTLTPRLLLWPLNTPASPKTSRLTLDTSAGAQLVSATSSDPAFTARLVPAPGSPSATSATTATTANTPSAAASATTDLEITPLTTERPARAVISVVVRLPSAVELTKTVHVRVR